jgi:acyl-CoA synthetase (AMP-forming)/AMP-acid ligase II
MVGAMFARCAFAPLSTSLTVAEQRLLISDADPQLVFADAEFADRDGCPPDRTIAIEQLDAWVAAGEGAGEPATPQGGDLFSIIYSSGTTGLPKGIAHTAEARAEFVAARPRPGFGPGRVGWVSTSLYTNFSFLGMISPLYFGAAVSVPARFAVEDFLRACEEEAITDVSLVPVQIKRVLEHPGFTPRRIASLQFTMISGSPIDTATKRLIAEQWPGRIVDSYGTTETGGIATLDLKAFPDRLETVGRIMDGVVVAILDESGRPLPDGENGEIAAVTPRPMEGYYNRAGMTADTTWHDAAGRRYLRTGDIGNLDADGFLRITGRAKDMIISGGLNVFACDIEDVLCAHPAVAEAAVVAIPDERWGETPCAFVALRGGADTPGEAILDWARERLARTSWPSRLEIVAALPRNDMGKVLKRELREPFWRGRESGVA